MTTTRRNYRLGPRDARGALGGLRWGQVVCLGVTAAVAMVGLVGVSGGRGAGIALLMATAGFVAAFVPVAGGRTAEQWAPICLSFLLRTSRGRHSFRSTAPGRGVRAGRVAVELPHELSGLSVLEGEIPGRSAYFGVVRDAKTRTYTGVISVRAANFMLLDQKEQEVRLDAWGQILSGLARERAPVSRIQWVERTATEGVDELGRYLAEKIALPREHASVGSYIDLIDQAGPVSCAHELYLSVQIDGGRRSREVRSAGGGDRGACAVLWRELSTVASQVRSGGLQAEVRGVLSPGHLARVLREGADPDERSRLEKGNEPSTDQAWPLSWEEGWGCHRAGGAYHATYWVSEWPRQGVGCDFLSPLLLATTTRRVVSLVMEPLSPLRALREAENAATAVVSDEELRQKAGFSSGARRRRMKESIDRREEELAQGHAAFRFVGYVGVSAPSLEELDRACAEVEQAAQQARCEVRRMWGEQAQAFTYTLPIGRGLS